MQPKPATWCRFKPALAGGEPAFVATTMEDGFKLRPEALEAAIEKTFGLFSEVMVRDPAEWAAIIKANPLPKKAREDPAHLVCLVCSYIGCFQSTLYGNSSQLRS